MRLEIEGSAFDGDHSLVVSKLTRELAAFGEGITRVAVRLASERLQRRVSILVVTRGFRCVTTSHVGATLPGPLERATREIRAAVAEVLGVAEPRRSTARPPRSHEGRDPTSAPRLRIPAAARSSARRSA